METDYIPRIELLLVGFITPIALMIIFSSTRLLEAYALFLDMQIWIGRFKSRFRDYRLVLLEEGSEDKSEIGGPFITIDGRKVGLNLFAAQPGRGISIGMKSYTNDKSEQAIEAVIDEDS